MNELFSDIRACAEETIPLKGKSSKQNFSSDLTVASLVAKKRDQTLKIKSAPSGSDVSGYRREVRKIQNSISKRLVQINNMKADALAEEINNTDDARKMFEASRSLAGIKKSGNIVVNDINNNPIGTDLGKANTAKSFFEKQLTEGVEAGLQPFSWDPKPLDNPITPVEVKLAASKLKSNRASGPDNPQNELIKYAHPITFEKYAEANNESFSGNKYISSIGQGIVTPLQKPCKPKGPLTSLIRPLTLLNGSRKMLTQIALKRVESRIDNYTMPWQSAYKRVSELGFPTEWEYSDDCDFADEDIEKLRILLPTVKEILKDWNLQE
ncbi:uncharacterized protein LOC134820219 [Bolinopsis microptera]|uniref:uncharacterized protein LOC134820219 n=1 Tax=Bolinopsis microptera TaxID=2820187 RepID=UPI003079D477